MATLDKQSLREEAERIKSEFDRLASNNKMDNDTKLLFKSMLMLINLLIVIFLEKTTKKTKNNSSKPSSQTEKDETSLSTNDSKGKDKTEGNHIAANTRTLETTVLIPVDYCDQCGESLKNTPCQCVERRTKIDIIFEKTVEHVDAEIKVSIKGPYNMGMVLRLL